MASAVMSVRQSMRQLLSGTKKPSRRVSESSGRMGCPLAGGRQWRSVCVAVGGAVGKAKAVEAEGVVGVGMVGHEDQHPEVVSQDVGELEP